LDENRGKEENAKKGAEIFPQKAWNDDEDGGGGSGEMSGCIDTMRELRKTARAIQEGKEVIRERSRPRT